MTFSINKKLKIALLSALALSHIGLFAEGSIAPLKDSPYESWGINSSQGAINITSAWKSFTQKKDVIVAVIDTGVDPTHSYLYKNLIVKNGKVNIMNFGKDFSKNSQAESRPSDSHGHGTHVSGIIRSVFPQVKILTLKYYNPKASGQDNLNSTIRALRYAVQQNVDIINYSGGGPEPAIEELKILREAEKKGILVIAAAGNEESNIDIKKNAYYPASYGLSNIISVTAHDQQLRILKSSNYGRLTVDIAAPGHRINSALPGNRAGFLTGTSQATAFVTGAAALLKAQYPKLTTKELKEIIRSSARKEITLMGKCISSGRLDAYNAQKLAAKYIKAKNNKSRKLATKEEGQITYRMAR